MFTADLIDECTRLLDELRAREIKVATAESCTGGLIAALLTEIAGSSDVFDRGFVTYSNAAKTELLGVPTDLIVRQGAVSEVVARSMATGALQRSLAGVTVAVTGVAGPGGGSAAKPVGLVHLATARHSGPVVHREAKFGAIGRTAIRLATVALAVRMLREAAA